MSRRIGFYRPRRMPSFRGRSIYLDGISDYLDLQGKTSYIFWYDNRSRPTTSDFYRPASWSFWVKFPQKTIDAVTTNYTLGGDMCKYIVKENLADWGGMESRKWGGYFIGLVGDGNDDVKIAAGIGRSQGTGVSHRAIRRGSTAIAPDTWYHIVVNFVGRDPSSGDINIEMWVNTGGTVNTQTLTAHYPSGINSGEMSGMNVLVLGYTGTDPQFQESFIGRSGTQYTAMWIAECAFWEGTAMDTANVTAIYNSGTPLASLIANSGNYTKAIGNTATGSLEFQAASADCKITLTSTDGTERTYKGITNGEGGNNGMTGTIAEGETEILFHCLPGTEYTATELLNAITGSNGHGDHKDATPVYRISGSTNGSGVLTLHQTVGGNTGNTDIVISGTGHNIVINKHNFCSGSDYLKGNWTLDGPAVSGSDQRLQIGAGRGRTTSTEYLPHASWQTMYANRELLTRDIINRGGTWTTETPS